MAPLMSSFIARMHIHGCSLIVALPGRSTESCQHLTCLDPECLNMMKIYILKQIMALFPFLIFLMILEIFLNVLLVEKKVQVHWINAQSLYG